MVLLLAIRPSVGDVMPGGPLGAFSRRAGYESAPGFTTLSLPFITSRTTQLHKQLQLQSP